jgi:uncharacterized DUF497 family protein
VQVNQIIWIQHFVDKLASKHGVAVDEVEEILHGRMKVRRSAKGDVEGEDLYMAWGRTHAGRYLAVFFILKRN